jgi:hypothetical protein
VMMTASASSPLWPATARRSDIWDHGGPSDFSQMGYRI